MSDVPRPPILSGTTPGKWQVEGTAEVWALRGHNHEFCARIAGDGVEQAEANARLIASAPDLALLLAEAVENYKRDAVNPNGESWPNDWWRRAERALGGKA